MVAGVCAFNPACTTTLAAVLQGVGKITSWFSVGLEAFTIPRSQSPSHYYVSLTTNISAQLPLSSARITEIASGGRISDGDGEQIMPKAPIFRFRNKAVVMDHEMKEVGSIPGALAADNERATAMEVISKYICISN
jgi:hypothetical protein